jgi:hypothetical protein
MKNPCLECLVFPCCKYICDEKATELYKRILLNSGTSYYPNSLQQNIRKYSQLYGEKAAIDLIILSEMILVVIDSKLKYRWRE